MPPAEPPIPERRARDPWREKMEIEVEKNTRITTDMKARVDEVHDLLLAIQGALKVMKWIGVAAKWITVILGMASAIALLWYQLTHGGELPKKP